MKKDRFKNVLIFVAGATPQIITETIYALAMQNPPIYTDEIYIITTTVGKKLILENLVERGIIKELQREYAMPEIPLEESSFIIIKDRDGRELDDLRNSEHNEILGDLIINFIRKKAQDPSARLLCSLAGGRKTMSFYLGAALQFFGRPWDKLYHLLVSPEFEANRDFYYKPKNDKLISCRLTDGSVKELSTAEAKIELIELPFIRLRDKLSLNGKSFSELVREGQKEVDTGLFQKELRVNLKERTVNIGELSVDMIPMHLLIYTTILNSKQNHCRHPERSYCIECTDCWTTLEELTSKATVEEMAVRYAQLYDNKPFKAEEFLRKWKDGLTFDVVRQNISKINRFIKENLKDDSLVPLYAISSIRKYGSSRYGVRVEREKIKIE